MEKEVILTFITLEIRKLISHGQIVLVLFYNYMLNSFYRTILSFKRYRILNVMNFLNLRKMVQSTRGYICKLRSDIITKLSYGKLCFVHLPTTFLKGILNHASKF